MVAALRTSGSQLERVHLLLPWRSGPRPDSCVHLAVKDRTVLDVSLRHGSVP